MARITIQNPEQTELQCIEEEDFGEAYEGWTIVAQGEPADPEDEIEDGEWKLSLTKLQQRKWKAVKQIRNFKENDIAPTPLGHPVQIDEASKAKIQGVLNMCFLVEEQGGTFAEHFTMADNAVIELNSAGIRQLAAAAAIYVSQVYSHARSLRDAIFAEDITREELDAIDIDDGWPPQQIPVIASVEATLDGSVTCSTD